MAALKDMGLLNDLRDHLLGAADVLRCEVETMNEQARSDYTAEQHHLLESIKAGIPFDSEEARANAIEFLEETMTPEKTIEWLNRQAG